MSMNIECNCCGNKKKLFDCPICGTAKYCSDACQQQDFPDHAVDCNIVTTEDPDLIIAMPCGLEDAEENEIIGRALVHTIQGTKTLTRLAETQTENALIGRDIARVRGKKVRLGYGNNGGASANEMIEVVLQWSEEEGEDGDDDDNKRTIVVPLRENLITEDNNREDIVRLMKARQGREKQGMILWINFAKIYEEQESDGESIGNGNPFFIGDKGTLKITLTRDGGAGTSYEQKIGIRNINVLSRRKGVLGFASKLFRSAGGLLRGKRSAMSDMKINGINSSFQDYFFLNAQDLTTGKETMLLIHVQPKSHRRKRRGSDEKGSGVTVKLMSFETFIPDDIVLGSSISREMVKGIDCRYSCDSSEEEKKHHHHHHNRRKHKGGRSDHARRMIEDSKWNSGMRTYSAIPNNPIDGIISDTCCRSGEVDEVVGLCTEIGNNVAAYKQMLHKEAKHGTDHEDYKTLEKMIKEREDVLSILVSHHVNLKKNPNMHVGEDIENAILLGSKYLEIDAWWNLQRNYWLRRLKKSGGIESVTKSADKATQAFEGGNFFKKKAAKTNLIAIRDAVKEIIEDKKGKFDGVFESNDIDELNALFVRVEEVLM